MRLSSKFPWESKVLLMEATPTTQEKGASSLEAAVGKDFHHALCHPEAEGAHQFSFSFLCLFLEIRSLCGYSGTCYVDQACSELRYDCFCLTSAGIKGVHHHAKLSQVGHSCSVNHNPVSEHQGL